MADIEEIKCPKNKACYGGYAGERAWLCDKVERIMVEHKSYIVINGEHNFALDRALDSFSSKLIYCSLLGEIRIS